MNASRYDYAPFRCDADLAKSYIIRKMMSEAKRVMGCEGPTAAWIAPSGELADGVVAVVDEPSRADAHT
jgi:hypothetical protein